MRAEGNGPAMDLAERNAVPAPPNVRAILRVGNEFFLRSVGGVVAAQGDDLIAGLIFTALWIGNVRHITHSPANTKFGGIDDLPPDAIRVPVSVQTLSNTLHIPYETVRRYAQAMINSGICIRVGKRGLIVPGAVHNQPQRRRIFQEGFPSLLRFVEDLKQAGFDFSPYRAVLPTTVALPLAGEMPVNIRALLRASMDLVMRGVDQIAELFGGDFLTGMIMTTVWTVNVRHITCSDENVKYGGMHQPVPDDLRQPVTVNAIAHTLRLPYETTRRYVSALVRDGTAVRIEGRGVIIPSARFIQPDYSDAAREFYDHMVQTVRELHRAGFDFSKY